MDRKKPPPLPKRYFLGLSPAWQFTGAISVLVFASFIWIASNVGISSFKKRLAAIQEAQDSKKGIRQDPRLAGTWVSKKARLNGKEADGEKIVKSIRITNHDFWYWTHGKDFSSFANGAYQPKYFNGGVYVLTPTGTDDRMIFKGTITFESESEMTMTIESIAKIDEPERFEPFGLSITFQRRDSIFD